MFTVFLANFTWYVLYAHILVIFIFILYCAIVAYDILENGDLKKWLLEGENDEGYYYYNSHKTRKMELTFTNGTVVLEPDFTYYLKPNQTFKSSRWLYDEEPDDEDFTKMKLG